MRITEIISELFSPDKALSFEWEKNGRVAEARLPDGRKILVRFNPMDNNVWGIEFSVGDQFEITGGGEVSTVFATVIAVVKDFLKYYPSTKAVYFTAEEQSRAKMYDTLTKRVAKDLGWHVVPHEEMVDDPKYQTPLSYGDFLFAIEPGTAPEHRQAAQKPQHGEFMPIYFVHSMEDPNLPVYKIKAKKSTDAEEWVIKHQPEYKDTDPFGVFGSKNPPPGRKIIDIGEVPASKPKRELNPLEKALHQKLSTD